jgi:hypothetical protein
MSESETYENTDIAVLIGCLAFFALLFCVTFSVTRLGKGKNRVLVTPEPSTSIAIPISQPIVPIPRPRIITNVKLDDIDFRE